MTGKTLRRWRTAAAFSALLASAGTRAEIVAEIDAKALSVPITPYEYGMFIEPIGGLISRSLWAEMLDDRKFHFPVAAEGKDPKQPDSAEGRPALVNRKWRPIGPDSAVTMDRADPYVGAQSARVAPDGTALHGTGQSGLGIAAGKQYVGHIILTGASRAQVSVSLIWGDRTEGAGTVWRRSMLSAAIYSFPIE